MAAGKYNILVQQGVTYNQTITLKNAANTAGVNITGNSIAAMIRETYNDPDPAAVFTCEIIDAVNGVFQIKLTPEQTGALRFTKGVYDIEMTYPDGSKDRLLQGNVAISLEATR